MIRLYFKILKIIQKIEHKFFIIFNRYYFSYKEIKFGKNLNVYYKIYLNIAQKSQITIGDNFLFTSGKSINPLCRNICGSIHTTRNAIIQIGNNVGISSACIWAKERIIIGNNVNIGGDTIIIDTDAHNLDYRIRNSKAINEEGISIDSITATSKPIIIEDDVLIGTRCIILKGVRIGTRSVIGSGSVVTKSIPADCIAAGNPCKIIKYINE